MSRANRPRGEDVPTVRESDAAPTSFESLLALGLCLAVILACMAFLRRSSTFSRVLLELQDGSIRPRRPRAARIKVGSEPRPELVIFVVIDGLRADRLDLYGHKRETAPNLRALGNEALVFTTAAVQSSWALSSHKSMLTGKYPATLMLEVTGADAVELAREREPHAYLLRTLRGARPLLAAGLARAGFRTAAFGGGGWLDHEAGLEHGFEVFETGGGQAADDGADTNAKALAWLARTSTTPAFLFLQDPGPICPYPASREHEDQYCASHAQHAPLTVLCQGGADGLAATSADFTALSDHYDAAVRTADERLGRFLAGLRAHELYDRALIVITSSHGESLGERGLAGHGGLFPEMLLVPLLLKFPAAWSISPGTLNEPVELVDLLPTLFALCGVDAPDDLDGRSLLPMILRGVRGRTVLAAQSTFDEVRASPTMRTLFRPGHWQVIHDLERSEASLFALNSDPLALVPHPIAAGELAPVLDLLLGRERADPRMPRGAGDPGPIGEELTRVVQELGYGVPASAGPGPAGDLR